MVSVGGFHNLIEVKLGPMAASGTAYTIGYMRALLA